MQCNYGVNGSYGVNHMIQGLAKEVEKRMDAAGVKGTKVTLKVKQRKPDAPPPPNYLGSGSCFNVSRSQDTRESSVLAHIGSQLFTQMKIPKDEIRGMGLVVSCLSEAGATEHEGIRKYFKQTLPTLMVQRQGRQTILTKETVDKTTSNGLK